MKLNIKNVSVRVLVVVFLCSFLSMDVFALIMGNRGREAFIEPTTASTAMSSASIEVFIIAGAGNFLNGYSEYLKVLNRVELATDANALDYSELQSVVNRAINSITKARDAYSNLVGKANVTSYDKMITNRLMAFDYALFKKERAMYGNVMDRIQQFLGKGDVRGVFAKLLSGTDSVLDLLNKIKVSVDTGRFPELSDLWRTNQAFSETMLFGQYAAEIFFAVTE